MKRILTSILITTAIVVQAQVGHYYLSHYTSNQQTSSLSFDIVQDGNGLMYFATRSGLKQFDGRNWKNVSSTSQIYTLCISPQGNIYTGGEDGIGMVERAADFSQSVNTIFKEVNIDIFGSASTEENSVFVSEQKLMVLSYKDQKVSAIALPKSEEAFTSTYELFQSVYVTTASGNTYKLDGKELIPIIPKRMGIIAFTSKAKNRYLVVNQSQQLFIADNANHITKVNLVDSLRIQADVIVSGTWVSDKLIALGTLNGGVVFIDPTTGSTQEIIDYYSGLPDNEIFCIKNDAEGNVWVGHEYGFTCIAPRLPFRSFNHYDGLSGNVLCATTFQGKVYVGTSVGLFRLEKIDKYENEIFYSEKKTKSLVPVTVAPAVESKKRGFFRFGKKKKENESVVKQEEKIVTTKVRQTRKVLVGTTYLFQKVQGLDSKVNALIQHDGKLFVAGLAGLYEVQTDKAISIVAEPVIVVTATQKYGIVGVTYRNRVFSWKDKMQTTVEEDLRDNVSSIVEDEENNLWLVGVKTLYQVSPTLQIKTFQYQNSTHDHTESMSLNGKPLIVNSSGFYTFVNGAVRVIDSLGRPTQFFALNSNIWYKRNEIWKCLGTFADHKNLEYLNVFSELRYIEAEENSEILWLVTKDNELFKFYTNQQVSTQIKYPLLVRSIRNGQQYYEPTKQLYQLEQQDGQLSIEVVQATFGSQQGAQYRYLLEGKEKKEWSEWVGENQISFPYLPLGIYKLTLQTRDVLGNITELKPIKLKINPPFWKMPWFYAMEFSVFAVLVVLSLRLQAMNQRYRGLAQVLAMITIVLLITLIQSAVSTYFVTTSPVIDFVMQVAIAFLVLPIEVLLRKVMFSTSEKNKLYQLINPSLKKPVI